MRATVWAVDSMANMMAFHGKSSSFEFRTTTMMKTEMSGVQPNNHSVGVLHPRSSCAAWFVMKQTKIQWVGRSWSLH